MIIRKQVNDRRFAIVIVLIMFIVWSAAFALNLSNYINSEPVTATVVKDKGQHTETHTYTDRKHKGRTRTRSVDVTIYECDIQYQYDGQEYVIGQETEKPLYVGDKLDIRVLRKEPTELASVNALGIVGLGIVSLVMFIILLALVSGSGNKKKL